MAAAAAGGAGAATGTSVSGNIGSGAGVAATTPQGNVAASGNSSDFMNALQDNLMQSAGAVSSNGNNITSGINSAISSLQTANTATNAGLASQNQADVATAQQQGNNNMTAQLEARRGMATNTGIVQNIQLTTNKSINDLEEKYQAAISTGDAATATQISNLQVQALQLKQTTLESAFQNMTAIASTMNTAQTTQLAQQTQNFAEQQAVANVGLQYGIKVTPGMTLAQMVSAAAPKASQSQQAQLGLVYAQTQAANEQAAQAAAGIAQLVTPDNASAMASSYFGSLTSGNTTGAAQLLTNAATQGPASQNALQTALGQQTNYIYSGDNNNSTPDIGSLTNTFLTQIQSTMKGYAPGSPQAAQAYQNISNQIQNMYATQGQNYGKFAVSQQTTAASQALAAAQTQYLNANGLGVTTVGDAVSNFFTGLFGGTPAAPTYNTPAANAESLGITGGGNQNIQYNPQTKNYSPGGTK